MNIVQTTGLCKQYGQSMRVRGLNLSVPEGCIYGFLGPNGAGKSTTLKMILGLVHPTAGQISVFGKAVNQQNRLDILKQVGSLIESPSYYGHLTGEENLRIVQTLRDVPERDVRQVLEIVRLQNQKDKKVAHYSLGMKQRLGIAAALLGTPKVIILDEPTVGLDPAQMIEIRSLIRDLGKTHTVILSSHILSEVQTVCDRVLIIAHGRLVAQGTPEELAAQLTAKGTITATAQGSREAVVAAAGKVPGLTDLRVTDEKGGEVSFTAVSTAGTDLRGALSLALAQAGCPVLNLSAETMSLEDVFLQLTETPESGKPESAAAPAENPPAEAAAEEENEKEANSDESNL